MKSVILYKFIESLVFYDKESPYAQLKEAINRIDNDYFDGIQRDCEVLPDELCPELRDNVIADFNHKISSLLTDSLCDDLVAQVYNNTSVLVSDSDIVALIEKLRTVGNSMQKCVVDLTVLDREITVSYQEAKDRTLVERIMRANKDDIIRFHHALQDNTVKHVQQLVEVEMGKFLIRLADKLHPSKS